ncbi:MAG: hypothetical protein IPN79_12085 [Saprospiraceae bacterium]|nr:hypothetical protein [Saprospiraceae bacterium]
MLGTKNGETEPDRKQTRYKYSPAHQDVAVCCNPNAGRISPYFVQNSWMKENDTTFVATLLMPNVLESSVNGNIVIIENITEYPNQNEFKFKNNLIKTFRFYFKNQKTNVGKIKNKRTVDSIENDFIVIDKYFQQMML